MTKSAKKEDRITVNVREAVGLPAAVDNSYAATIVKRWLNILSEQDSLRDEMKDLKAEIKARGHKAGYIKALALAVKEHRNPVDGVIKANANIFFLGSGGQYEIFKE